MDEYIVIEEGSRGKFTKLVNQKLKEGYSLAGGLSIAIGGEYLQALQLKDKK